jgi:hypothetical protein
MSDSASAIRPLTAREAVASRSGLDYAASPGTRSDGARVAVAARNTKAHDASYTRLVISRTAAAVLGGYAVTYWAGAASAELALKLTSLRPIEAGMLSGLVQLVVYTVAIIWVCAAASMRKAWLAIAVVTALLFGIAVLLHGTPGAT